MCGVRCVVCGVRCAVQCVSACVLGEERPTSRFLSRYTAHMLNARTCWCWLAESVLLGQSRLSPASLRHVCLCCIFWLRVVTS